MYRECQPNISVVLLHDKKIALVQPTADESRMTWILPQGGIKTGESIQEAVHRELDEELGVAIESDIVVLGKYVNKLPRQRRKKQKVMVVVAARALGPTFRINATENRDAIWASGEHSVFSQIGHRMEARRDKVLGMLESIQCAHKCGWVNWSCDETLKMLRNYSPEMVAA